MPIINQVVKGGGAPAPVINELNVVPSTSPQTITAPTGVDGYSPINVSAVTSSIDANIAAGNIKDGVTILGVTGSVVELKGETKTVVPQVYGQTIYPSTAKNGITEITVNPVTSAIDANITAGNIKKDVSILGVTGTYEGAAPTGTMYIISNGIYNVADKAIANVQVPATGPAQCVEKRTSGTKLVNGNNIIDLSGITDIGDYVLTYAYYGVNFPSSTSVNFDSLTAASGNRACNNMFANCNNVTSADLSSVVTITGSYAFGYMFQYCISLTALDLGSLTTVSGQNACYNMATGCTLLTTVDLSSLVTVSGDSGCNQMFGSCTGLTSIDLSSLTTISGTYGCQFMFSGCTGITSVDLSSLTTITGNGACGYMFYRCNNLTTLSFPAITSSSFGTNLDQFNNMCRDIPSITLHFPSNVQSVIEGLTGYSATAPFGATSGSVVFDLPATE